MAKKSKKKSTKKKKKITAPKAAKAKKAKDNSPVGNDIKDDPQRGSEDGASAATALAEPPADAGQLEALRASKEEALAEVAALRRQMADEAEEREQLRHAKEGLERLLKAKAVEREELLSEHGDATELAAELATVRAELAELRSTDSAAPAGGQYTEADLDSAAKEMEQACREEAEKAITKLESRARGKIKSQNKEIAELTEKLSAAETVAEEAAGEMEEACRAEAQKAIAKLDGRARKKIESLKQELAVLKDKLEAADIDDDTPRRGEKQLYTRAELDIEVAGMERVCREMAEQALGKMEKRARKTIDRWKTEAQRLEGILYARAGPSAPARPSKPSATPGVESTKLMKAPDLSDLEDVQTTVPSMPVPEMEESAGDSTTQRATVRQMKVAERDGGDAPSKQKDTVRQIKTPMPGSMDVGQDIQKATVRQMKTPRPEDL
ncbi:hypothetical protein ACFL59_12525 [Planctomycetota bacterium]